MQSLKSYSRKKKIDPEPDYPNLPVRTRKPVDDEVERKHFQKVVNSFRHYRSHLEMKILLNKRLLEQLPDRQQQLLQTYKDSLNTVQGCVEHNQDLIALIIENIERMFENANPPDVTDSNGERPSVSDIERVQTTLKQFVRDWSAEGASERSACYQPIIDEIVSHFPPKSCTAIDIKVLVPGSGLGRLAFEIAHRGYTCQGNEFSLYMLIASNFVLNRCNEVEKYGVYPWIHQLDNHLTSEHQTQIVRFPDVNPYTLLRPNKSQFTMAAGDFLEIYKNSEEWNCVATCFFIDCANNIVDFIEKIYDILQPGGIWVNLGPLLYHYSNMPGEFSIEPPYSTVREVIIGVGFQIEKEEIGLKTKYGQNPNSMLQYEYNSVFFVCKKPPTDQDLTVLS